MLDWQEIETVLLDMDGTLIDLHFDNYFWQQLVPERWGASRGLSQEEALKALMPRFAAVAGTLEWYCLDYWRDTLELDIMALKREIAHKIRWRPDVQPFLQALRDSGRPLYLFTNAHPDSLALKLEQTGLDRYLDGLYSTHHFGYSKEHHSCWQALQARLGFESQHTLFVDDSLPILEAARRYGIGHLLGISNPDSQRPANAIRSDIPFINDYSTLLLIDQKTQ